MTDMSFYGIRMAWQNSSTGQNFFDGCVGANVSSVDALLHFRCNAVSKALPIKVPLDRLKDALDEALDITAAYSEFNDEWRPQLAALQGRVSPSRTPSRSSKPSRGGGRGGAVKAAAAGAGGGGQPASASASKRAAGKGGAAPPAGSRGATGSKPAAARSRTATRSG